MKFTYYGHACFSVEIAGKHLLFDPFITPNPLAKDVDIKKIPADFILVTHGHEDHLADVVKIAKLTKALVIANYEVAEWLQKKGAPETHGLNPGGEFDFPFGKVQFVNAIHSSSFPNGDYAGTPGGFVVKSKEGNFYYSGDTALTYDMKLIGETIKLNFAVLCIGNNFTMGVADAIRAADFIRCKNIVGVHYDTFPQIKINHADAQNSFKKAGLELQLLSIGETRSL
jgi:L-ascorbate metabolism protein UlaG (beta-lactamase superfamily)